MATICVTSATATTTEVYFSVSFITTVTEVLTTLPGPTFTDVFSTCVTPTGGTACSGTFVTTTTTLPGPETIIQVPMTLVIDAAATTTSTLFATACSVGNVPVSPPVAPPRPGTPSITSPRGTPTAPTSTPTGTAAPAQQSSSAEKKFPMGPVIGGAVGGVVLLAALAFFMWKYFHKPSAPSNFYNKADGEKQDYYANEQAQQPQPQACEPQQQPPPQTQQGQQAHQQPTEQTSNTATGGEQQQQQGNQYEYDPDRLPKKAEEKLQEKLDQYLNGRPPSGVPLGFPGGFSGGVPPQNQNQNYNQGTFVPGQSPHGSPAFNQGYPNPSVQSYSPPPSTASAYGHSGTPSYGGNAGSPPTGHGAPPWGSPSPVGGYNPTTAAGVMPQQAPGTFGVQDNYAHQQQVAGVQSGYRGYAEPSTMPDHHPTVGR
ncbi:hypothetical protein B0H34DRAFT_795353 [Crassisporium funariophilum]|nr:hypothetical protein B0H34DRAFT_795353 [Crassisporium funariophilum]